MDIIPSRIQQDVSYGFLDSSRPAEKLFNPMLVSNYESNTMYKSILEELRRSRNFTFSVAFVSSDAIGSLKQPLIEFAGRGRIITSTYLGFNSPESFRELANLRGLGIDVFVYEDELRGFHPKGFIFEQEHGTTAIVGSSNLTSRALKRNHEWNLRFSALPGGDIVDQLTCAVEVQLQSSTLLTDEWIREYEARYEPPRVSQPFTSVDTASKIVPNAMQTEALKEIAKVRESGERRALVVSATGTGKTILAALDVQSVNPQRVLFVVHREQILDRAIEEFSNVLGLTDADIGKFVRSMRQLDRRFVFATVQSLGSEDKLAQIPPDYFDYILIDEVHRAGAAMHQNIISYFEPAFMLGITATPERTDAFNVYRLFDFNVPYEIRLQKALEADMLAPFHYYGVTDFEIHGEVVSEASQLKTLIAPERVAHLIKAIERYGHVGEQVKGLMFCSGKAEARELSTLLNQRKVHGKQLRTRALTGDDPVDVREQAVEQLEKGELDYIITRDVFNEGIDIRAVNQVVMLRQTQSSIVFTQQLGRGLRKSVGKSHLIVIDFIGNYANNFQIPIALFGDTSLSKESLRRKMIESRDVGVVSGLSSVNFDQISRERIFSAIAKTPLNGVRVIKQSFLDLNRRLGRVPYLLDFARYEIGDPVVVANARNNYWELLRTFKIEDESPPRQEAQVLTFLSREIINGKRPHELILLSALIECREKMDHLAVRDLFIRKGTYCDEATLASVRRVLTLEFFVASEKGIYSPPMVVWGDDGIRLESNFESLYDSKSKFASYVDDAIATGLYVSRHTYDWSKRFEVGQKYSRSDACRLLNWEKNQKGVVNGYRADRHTLSCPIFVNYLKGEGVTASTNYGDRFITENLFRWFTRPDLTLESKEVKQILSGDYDLHLFVKKDSRKDDPDHYYMGPVSARRPFETKQPNDSGGESPIVAMDLELDSSVEFGLYDYLTSTIPGAAGQIDFSHTRHSIVIE